MLTKSSLFLRNAIRHIRKSHDHHDHGGIPGRNLPFDISNRYKLTAYFILFFGSGFGAPFLILRHQLKKD